MMAESEISRQLKDLPTRILTSKLKERELIFNDLQKIIVKNDIPEGIIKGLCKLQPLTLHRYVDNKSRFLVQQLINLLAQYHSPVVVKSMSGFFTETSNSLKSLHATKNIARSSLTILSWSTALLHGMLNRWDDSTTDEFQKLIEAQTVLFSAIVAAGNPKLLGKAYQKMCTFWKQVKDNVDVYAKTVSGMEQSAHTVIMSFFIMKFLSENKLMDITDRYKVIFIESYIKIIVGSKTKPPLYTLEHSKYLLKHVSHELFKQTLLPAVQKAMLRNPEVILECVSFVLNGLPVDLSQYALDIGKPLAACLHSQNDTTRDEAAVACKYLAQQCSDSEAICSTLKHFFAVLNGSEGKLTVTVQRIGVITGIGNLSYNMVTGNSAQQLATTVSGEFIKLLEQEVHEGTLVHILSVFSLWCAKFSTEVPGKLIEWFKKGIGLKTSTAAVRNSYIQCMSACFHGNTLAQCEELIPVLSKIVEKASNQPTQIPTVTEGLSAACLLLSMSADIGTDGKLASILNIIVDMEKQLFLNEKFLTSASEDTLLQVMIMAERLIVYHPELLKDNKPLYHAIIFVMTKPSLKLRQQVFAIVKKLMSLLGGYKLTKALIQEFSAFIDTKRAVSDAQVEKQENGKTNNVDNNIGINSCIYGECLIVLTSKSFSELNANHDIAFDSLICSHHPTIVWSRPTLWINILKKLNIHPFKFVELQKLKIVKLLTDPSVNQLSAQNALKTLVKLNSSAILPPLLKNLSCVFKNNDLLLVTQEDYFIFLTPDGELYDKSVIENSKEEIVQSKNIKRESKAYSYKEQMEEIELRKEIEAKKKAKGVKNEPQLSQKQQTAIKTQIAKESAIREQIRNLHLQVSCAVDLLKAAIEGNPEAVNPVLLTIIELLIPTFQSPVAAPFTTEVFLDLHKCVLDSQYIGILVPNVALRLLKPQCTLNPAWCEENLGKAVPRTVDLLHNFTVRGQSKVSFEDPDPIIPEPLTATAFSYCFPLLQCVLHNGGEVVGKSEVTIVQSLEIISIHLQIRKQSNDFEDYYSPQFLPRKNILELMVEVIEVTSGKIQQLACKVLLEVSTCASGLEDCAIASQEEINVLLLALQNPMATIREVALQSLTAMSLVLPDINKDPENYLILSRRIWVARFDCSEDNKKLADSLWVEADLQPDVSLCEAILKDVTHPEAVIRQSGAEALASLLNSYYDEVEPILQKLLEIYREKLVLPPPVVDNFGRIISDNAVDNWEPRSGIAIALGQMANFFTQKTVANLMTFFVEEGLGDRHAAVRKHMLDAALAIVNIHGKEAVSNLLPVFEKFLNKAPNKASFDAVRQSVVILMGTLAHHLDKDDPRVKPIVVKLVESLSTPSQQVQDAVANCLHPLVPAIKEDAPALVKRLLKLLLESPSYGERKGSAYGLAGLVKGLGILALKQLDIMSTLTEAIQDKKNARHREGALFAFEQLFVMLGRLFEPYVVHILPHLLLCFGDQNHHVRQATDDTAKAVMSKLSAHGVKLVLPSLLAALQEDSWRTKTGSVELLGAMAFCAPKQLSSCLPSIVPKLIEVLSDSHPKVQKAGAQALKQIGSVIRNPEIQAIVPTLLDALQDPSRKTATCLQTLLDTKFVHFIDAPSLALIMPVVQRAFQDRSTETRKMAAQIIGNMYSLTDQKDLAPYLPNIIPGLKQSLLDPVPEVRSVSARALGAMVKGMGEGNFEDLLPWLMQTLTSETSSVDRSGAAQGLSEVVGGLGVEKLQKLMPDIIATAERTDIAPHVKDGYIMMFIYMPVVFQKEFTPYIGQIINPILKALADENEFVRDTALRAGQRIVNMYAESAIMLLLPELEKGLFDNNWRIRYSSVQLLGDLLYKISGVSGKMSTETADEDDNFGTEQSHKAILAVLGAERRNRVLAGLYMGRSDVALMVRQAALHVWKVVVTNTPRTLREILPMLFSLLLGCLASTSYDKRQVAARTLGDLVRKLGERVLPEIIPILERGLESDRADQRQGVCIGLSEIMASTSKDMVLSFVDSLVPTVRKALCDPLPEVRHAAARTFESLHSTVGVRALDDILPNLLRQLNHPELGEYTLDGLRQVMAIKSRVVLPYLVPQLTAQPVNTKALSILASVAGDALTRHLSKILPALLTALSEASDTPNEQQELEYCQSVVLSVTDNVGVRTVMDELLEATRSDSIGVRRAAVSLLYAFCSHTKADYQQYVPQLLRGLIHLFTDRDERVLQLSWEALNAVTRNLDPPEMLQHVGNVRQAVRFAVSDLKGQQLLPGFCLAKGITPILPIFREAILNGAPELKEQAAQGLGEVIRLTSADALKPSVVNITGPLIRILGDRFNWNVKVAVLETLALLLAKVGMMLKAFLPQLQTTFLKALSDPNRQVRLRAAAALSHLIVIHSRADPLFTELYTAVKNSDDSAIRETMLQALRVIICPAGDKIGDSVRKTMTSTLLSMLAFPEDTSRMAVAGCLGALCRWLPEEELNYLVKEHLLDDDASLDWIVRHGRSVALTIAIKEASNRVVTSEWTDKVIKLLISHITADRIPLVLNGIRGTGYFLKHQIAVGGNIPPQLVQVLAKSMNHSSNEVKQLVAQVAHFMAKSFDHCLPDAVLKPLIPMLVNGTKEKNTMVKANSEFALVAILRLRLGDETQQICLNLLDSGAREALGDVIVKVLRKVANQPEPKEEELDDTLLT